MSGLLITIIVRARERDTHNLAVAIRKYKETYASRPSRGHPSTRKDVRVDWIVEIGLLSKQ